MFLRKASWFIYIVVRMKPENANKGRRTIGFYARTNDIR